MIFDWFVMLFMVGDKFWFQIIVQCFVQEIIVGCDLDIDQLGQDYIDGQDWFLLDSEWFQLGEFMFLGKKCDYGQIGDYRCDGFFYQCVQFDGELEYECGVLIGGFVVVYIY